MANAETRIVVDSDTVIILPPGQSLKPQDMASIVSFLPQLEKKDEINSTNGISNSLNDSVASSAISTTIQSTKTVGSPPQKSDKTSLNQVLSPISLNLLTPENSPSIPPVCTTTPKVAKGRFLTQFDESPITPVSSPLVNYKKAAPSKTVAVCSKPPVVEKDVKPFGTLVFFDLETTGLGHLIGKSNVQITEISMIAVDRKEFWQSENSELKEIRVMHKLCMCVRPRSIISPEAAKITGLDNFNLIDQYPFDRNAAQTIISFLSHLPKPVCLLAHNGNFFDFPLLKAEFQRLSLKLPSDLLVADTLAAFRSAGIVEVPPDRKVCKSVKYGRNGRLSHSLENLHLFFFNKKPVNGHSSEGDCVALAKVCHKLKENALPWLEANAQMMENIVPMW